MGKDRFAFKSSSFAFFGVLIVSVQVFHPITGICVDIGQTAAWIAAIFAACLAALLLWPVMAMLRSTPGGSLMDLAGRAAGRPGKVATGLLMAGTLSFMGGTILRESSEMAISSVYPHTPETFATVSLLAAAIWVAWGETYAVVRIGRILAGMVVGAAVFIMIGTWSWGQIRYLLPLWGPGPVKLVAGTPLSTLLYAPLGLLPLLAAGVKDRAGLPRWTLAAVGVSAVILVAAKVVMNLVYPYPEITELPFPLHAAARFMIGGRFFERLEALWLYVWVFGTAAGLGALIHGGAVAFTRAFSITRHQVAVPTIATLVLTLAFFPRDAIATIHWHKRAGYLIFGAMLVLPALLAITAAMRGKRHPHEA